MAIQHAKTDKQYNTGYLIALLFTICLGTVQFGYSVGSWNSTFEVYARIHGWGDEKSSKHAIVQSLNTGGSAVGALLSGPLA